MTDSSLSSDSPNSSILKNTEVLKALKRNERRRYITRTRIIATQDFDPIDFYLIQLVKILKPVALTMVLVVISVRFLYVEGLISEGAFDDALVSNENSSETTSEKVSVALLNALLIVGVILISTIIFVILYKFHCTKIIYGWLMFSTFLLLGVFGGTYFLLVLENLNMNVDVISYFFFIVNFGVGGIFAIFFNAPKLITQGYLVAVSVIMATHLLQLPDYTTWALLAIVAIYDICAVLGPKGPLKYLVNEAETRQEPIPGLVYSAMLFHFISPSLTLSSPASGFTLLPTGILLNSTQNRSSPDENSFIDEPGTINEQEPQETSTGTSSPPASRNTAVSTKPAPKTSSRHWRIIWFDGTTNMENEGLKLGLGDFIFYSVLLGRAALFDYITVITCMVGLLAGLILTLYILTVAKKALPALPISIAFGILFYVCAKLIIAPFVWTLAPHSVFI